MDTTISQLIVAILVISVNVMLATALIGRPLGHLNQELGATLPVEDLMIVEGLDQDLCPVCHHVILNGQMLVACSECNLVYHDRCADLLLEEDGKCIRCRALLSEQQGSVVIKHERDDS